ncbi:MAG: prepilin peptidase [Pseudomonadota bacterium]
MHFDISTILMLLCAAALALCVLYAAYTDLRAMRITNATCLAALIAYVPLAGTFMLTGQWQLFLQSIGLGVLVFAITAFLNARGVFGGGDVKLLTVLAIWAGPQFAAQTFFIVAVCGGLISIFGLMRSFFLRRRKTSVSGRDTLPIQQHPIPYGPAITVGGLYLSSQLIVNALVQ